MSGVPGQRRINAEQWMNTAMLPDKIIGFREILRVCYAIGIIDDFSTDSQRKVKRLLDDYTNRANWQGFGIWKICSGEKSAEAFRPEGYTPVRKVMPPDQRVVRDASIISDWHRGEHDKNVLAERYGISRTRVTQIIQQALARAPELARE